MDRPIQISTHGYAPGGVRSEVGRPMYPQQLSEAFLRG
jgi:hypothetical protein